MVPDACDVLNAVSWPDSKLLGVEVGAGEDGTSQIVKLHLDLLEGTKEPRQLRRKVLTFGDCRLLKADIDLLGKRLCSNDIFDAHCSVSSERRSALVSELAERFNLYRETADAFDGYVHFRLALVPPGGELEILGKEATLA